MHEIKTSRYYKNCTCLAAILTKLREIRTTEAKMEAKTLVTLMFHNTTKMGNYTFSPKILDEALQLVQDIETK